MTLKWIPLNFMHSTLPWPYYLIFITFILNYSILLWKKNLIYLVNVEIIQNFFLYKSKAFLGRLGPSITSSLSFPSFSFRSFKYFYLFSLWYHPSFLHSVHFLTHYNLNSVLTQPLKLPCWWSSCQIVLYFATYLTSLLCFILLTNFFPSLSCFSSFTSSLLFHPVSGEVLDSGYTKNYMREGGGGVCFTLKNHIV